MVASQPTQAAAAVSRWQQLTTNDRLGFTDYAGFALAYPTYPRMELIRTYAERSLDRDAPSPEQIAAFFDRFPPQTNPARARYALALSTLNRPEARDVARAARLALHDVQEGQPLTAALRSVGIKVEVSCEQGVCGTCLTRVKAGTPDHRDQYLTPKEQAANDQFLPCCSRASSPRLVLDL